jgi:hypothetical protein
VCGKFLKIHHLQHEFVGEGIKKEFSVWRKENPEGI